MWGCFLMSGVKILHFLKDWWKSIPIHQNYTMALICEYWNRMKVVIKTVLSQVKMCFMYPIMHYTIQVNQWHGGGSVYVIY